jgi:hypothetical protein
MIQKVYHMSNKNPTMSLHSDILLKNRMWVEHLKKLDPLSYRYNIIYEHKSLLNKSIKNVSFIKKVFPIIQSSHSNNYMSLIDNYLIFLNTCKQHPNNIVRPNLLQDFVWHSHMMNNTLYIKDSNNFFGYILNHDTSMSDEELDRKAITTNKNKMFRQISKLGECGSSCSSSNSCSSSCSSKCNNKPKPPKLLDY